MAMYIWCKRKQMTHMMLSVTECFHHTAACKVAVHANIPGKSVFKIILAPSYGVRSLITQWGYMEDGLSL